MIRTEYLDERKTNRGSEWMMEAESHFSKQTHGICGGNESVYRGLKSLHSTGMNSKTMVTMEGDGDDNNDDDDDCDDHEFSKSQG